MIQAAVVGASGYAGGELLRILSRHPEIEVAVATSETYAGKPISASFPGLARSLDIPFTTYGDGSEIARCKAVFLAQENGKAMEQAPTLLAANCQIVDLSADFRFRDPAVYAHWYGQPHSAPRLCADAEYGLPELFRQTIEGAALVGNPGCYPTASILGSMPLLAAQRVHRQSIVIDAKSGISGAGRAKFGLDYHFAEANESVSAYKLGGTHRHTPEIEQALGCTAGSDIRVTFSPHLIPMTRGILATCYGALVEPVGRETLLDDFRKFYRNAPFVVVHDEGTPATKQTLGSNYCHIGVAVDERAGRAIVISVIDNLVKGAAGQAIQNMNLMLGLDETAGLDFGGIWP